MKLYIRQADLTEICKSSSSTASINLEFWINKEDLKGRCTKGTKIKEVEVEIKKNITKL